jgi:uridine kinase
MSSSWIYKYRPQYLDDIVVNKKIADILTNMKHKQNYTHFGLFGPSGSGKRTLIKLFLKSVALPEHVMWVNHTCFRTIESKEKLNSFLDSKILGEKKWLIVENLSKIISLFSYTLFNLLAGSDVIVCIIDTKYIKTDVDLSNWVVLLNMETHTDTDLISIGERILQHELIENNKEILQECVEQSSSNLYSFIFQLQTNFEQKISLKRQTIPMFAYEKIINSPILIHRLQELRSLEAIGYSHMDIAIHLHNYLLRKSKNVDIVIEIGHTIEHLSHHEYDQYHLYACICKIWNITKN